MRNIQETPRAFCHRYTMRNALGLENLGPYFDNTKLIVAGLIFIPLKYLGFVWIKEDQYIIEKTINSVQLATLNVGSALFIFLTRVSGIVWAKRPADQLGSKQYIGFRQAPFKLHLRRLLFNEEFYRTRKQIADGTSQFKKHSCERKSTQYMWGVAQKANRSHCWRT